MTILGKKAVAFIDLDKRGAREAHGVDAYVGGRCPLHYCLLEFFNPKTRAYLKTGTYKLYPRYSKVPSISEADKTLLVAQEMLTKLQMVTSNQATEKMQHNKALQQLTEILQQGEAPQRVGRERAAARSPCTPQRVQAPQPAARSPCAPQRVPAPQQQSQPQRVGNEHNTTTDPTNPDRIRTTRYVHQKKTRANQHPIGEPLPTIWEEAQSPQQAPTPGQHRPWPTRTVHGQKIGGKKNNVKHAAIKRVKKLVAEQMKTDAQGKLHKQANKREARAERREQRRRQKEEAEKQATAESKALQRIQRAISGWINQRQQQKLPPHPQAQQQQTAWPPVQQT